MRPGRAGIAAAGVHPDYMGIGPVLLPWASVAGQVYWQADTS